MLEKSLSQKFKAILFDLDGTLRLNIPNSVDVFADCLKGLGVEASGDDHTRAERWEHFYFANSFEIQADSKTYKDDEKGFWVNFTKRRLIALGLHNGKADELAPHISDCMETNYKPQSQLPDGIHHLLQELQEKDYILGVVSNRGEPFHEELESLGLKHYFGFTLAGGEVNSFKPDPGIFEHALKLAGTSAHETMYIGDNYFADVVGSLRAGLTPVLYDPNLLFPEAECDVIRSFDELHGLIN
jgi:HAD superfamily hydrolase (TIGR01549 family)